MAKLTKAEKEILKKLGSQGGLKSADMLTEKQKIERARKAGKASGKARKKAK